MRHRAIVLTVVALCMSCDQGVVDPAGRPDGVTPSLSVQSGGGDPSFGLPAAADTYILSDTDGGDEGTVFQAVNQGHGSEETLWLSSSPRVRTLVRYDLGPLSGLTVESAKLEFTITSAAQVHGGGDWKDQSVDAHRLNEAWTEAGATWNCADDASPNEDEEVCSRRNRWKMTGNERQLAYDAMASATVPLTDGQTGVVELDVTEDVTKDVTAGFGGDGWLVKLGSEEGNNGVGFGSRESASGPHLAVVCSTSSLAAEIGALFPEELEAAAQLALCRIEALLAKPDAEGARAEAFGLIDYVLASQAAIKGTAEEIGSLIEGIQALVFPTEDVLEIPEEAFGEFGAVEVVDAAGSLVVSEAKRVVMNLPAGAVDDDVLIVIAPAEGPLPNYPGQQYGDFYSIQAFPAQAFDAGVEVVVDICTTAPPWLHDQSNMQIGIIAQDASDPQGDRTMILNPAKNPSPVAGELDCDGPLPSMTRAEWLGRQVLGRLARLFGPEPLRAAPLRLYFSHNSLASSVYERGAGGGGGLGDCLSDAGYLFRATFDHNDVGASGEGAPPPLGTCRTEEGQWLAVLDTEGGASVGTILVKPESQGMGGYDTNDMVLELVDTTDDPTRVVLLGETNGAPTTGVYSVRWRSVVGASSTAGGGFALRPDLNVEGNAFVTLEFEPDGDLLINGTQRLDTVWSGGDAADYEMVVDLDQDLVSLVVNGRPWGPSVPFVSGATDDRLSIVELAVGGVGNLWALDDLAIIELGPVATVEVTPASSQISAGDFLLLTATLRDANGSVLTGRAVTWASDQPSVASVNASGVVIGTGPGTAVITAESEGISGSATVTVGGVIQGVVVNDRDGDQNTVDPGEAPPPTIVNLYANDGPSVGELLSSTTTDLWGRYRFDGLETGTYLVEAIFGTVLPPYVVLRDYADARGLTLVNTVVVGISAASPTVGSWFPFPLPAWDYLTSAGINLDPTHFTFLFENGTILATVQERGATVSGVTTILWRCNDAPGASSPPAEGGCASRFSFTAEGTTDADGVAVFTGLPEGTYSVTALAPLGQTATTVLFLLRGNADVEAGTITISSPDLDPFDDG